jgi:hypothetical protein
MGFPARARSPNSLPARDMEICLLWREISDSRHFHICPTSTRRGQPGRHSAIIKASAAQLPAAPHFRHKDKRCGADQTKTDVVVEVIRFVPVAIRTARVVSIVVPRTAAQDAGLLLNEPFTTNLSVWL